MKPKLSKRRNARLESSARRDVLPTIFAGDNVEAQSLVLAALCDSSSRVSDPELIREASGTIVVNFPDDVPLRIVGRRIEGLRDYSQSLQDGNVLYRKVSRHYQALLLEENRLDNLIDRLADAPFSKSLFLPTAHLSPSGQIPCLMYLWLRVRDEKLHLHAHWRGNDVHKKLLMNLDIMAAVQRHCCRRLDLRPGSYHHVSDSLHLYRDDAASIDASLRRISANSESSLTVSG